MYSPTLLLKRVMNAVVAGALVLGLALAAFPAPAQAAEQTYLVKSGDNLSRIARQFVVTVDDLRAANGLRGDTLFPGQELTIPTPTIVGRAVAAGSFKTLVAAVQAAGLVDALSGAGPLTVFAPTDAAFAKLPAATLNAILADKALLTQILTYHVVPGQVLAADVVGLSAATALQGETIAIKVEGGQVKVNNATVTATDIAASNGVIHVIDTVILPPSVANAPAAAPAPAESRYVVKAGDSLGRIARANAVTVDDLKAANGLRGDTIFPGQRLTIPTPDLVGRALGAGSFKTLAAALRAAGLVEALKGAGPYTVFAPTDAAFAKLPAATLNTLLANPDLLAKVLLYHVVPGNVLAADVVNLSSAATLNGARVSIAVAGGQVKVDNAAVTATDIPASNGTIHVIDTVILPPLDVLDTAVLNGNFKTLVTAVKAAGLESALRAAGPYTVFAPTDAAFAKLPAGTVAALLKDPAALSNILLYHVAAGQLRAAEVVGLSAAPTLQGASAKVTAANGQVKLDGATVIATDILASNGVIHVLDSVLLPPQ